MRRNYWIIAVTIPLLIVAGDVVYWRIAVERLRTGYRDWISNSVDQGWEISSGVVSIGGWPWAATVAIPEVTLRHAGSALPGNLQVAAVGVTLSISMFKPANLLISMSGPVHLRAADMPDLVLASEENWVSVSLVDGGWRTINLHATGLRVEPAMAAWHATAGLVNAQAKVVDEVQAPAVRTRRILLSQCRGDRAADSDEMAAGWEYFVAVAGRRAEWTIARESGCYELGRSLARCRRVVGDQPSRVGVGAIRPNILGNAGAGRSASANGQRQRTNCWLCANAGPLGGGGDIDQIGGDRCQGDAVADGGAWGVG